LPFLECNFHINFVHQDVPRYHGLFPTAETFPLHYWHPLNLDTSISVDNAPLASPNVLDIALNSLHVNANCQTLASLIEIAQSSKFAIAESRRKMNLPVNEEPKDEVLKDYQSRKMKLTVHVSLLKVILARENQSIVEVTIRDVFARVCCHS
jgi:hypothetical protein